MDMEPPAASCLCSEWGGLVKAGQGGGGLDEQEHGTGHAQDDGGHDGGDVARRLWKSNTSRPIPHEIILDFSKFKMS